MRRSLVLAGAIALFAATGCAQWQGQVAARVGDAEITVEEVERDMAVIVPDAPKTKGRLDTASVGQALSIRIQGALFDRELAARKITVTAQEIDAARQQLSQQVQSASGEPLSDDLVRFVAAQQRLQAAVAEDPGGPPANPQELLDSDPQSFSPVCVELASVSDLDVADQLLDGLRGGTSLGELATEFAAEVQSDCLAPFTMEAQGFGTLAAALRSAKADDVLGPIEEPAQGLILVGVVTSVGDPDLAAATQAWNEATGPAIREVLLEQAKQTSVFVDPRYGVWDPTALSLLPPGSKVVTP